MLTNIYCLCVAVVHALEFCLKRTLLCQEPEAPALGWRDELPMVSDSALGTGGGLHVHCNFAWYCTAVAIIVQYTSVCPLKGSSSASIYLYILEIMWLIHACRADQICTCALVVKWQHELVE